MVGRSLRRAISSHRYIPTDVVIAEPEEYWTSSRHVMEWDGMGWNGMEYHVRSSILDHHHCVTQPRANHRDAGPAPLFRWLPPRHPRCIIIIAIIVIIAPMAAATSNNRRCCGEVMMR